MIALALLSACAHAGGKKAAAPAKCSAGHVNCFQGPSAGTWFASPNNWSRDAFPNFPQEAHLAGLAVLTQEARGAAEVLDLGADGLLDISWDSVLDLGPDLCRGGEFEEAPLTLTSNRKCTRWTECKASEWQVRPGDAHNDRVCRACPAGHWCDGFGKTACPAAHYAHAGQAHKCLPWTTCSKKQWETQAPSAVRDRFCAAIDECDVGQWEVEKPKYNANRVCEDCPAGYRCPNRKAHLDSSSCSCSGETHTITFVTHLPPSEDRSSIVSVESRNGTCAAPPGFEVSACNGHG